MNKTHAPWLFTIEKILRIILIVVAVFAASVSLGGGLIGVVALLAVLISPYGLVFIGVFLTWSILKVVISTGVGRAEFFKVRMSVSLVLLILVGAYGLFIAGAAIVQNILNP